jgi:hypothetical protein
MNKRPGYLFVLPWTLTHDGGVNQVVLNLYREFEAAGEFAPKILVTSWTHVRPLTTIEHGNSIAYLRVRPPIVWDSPYTSVAKWALRLIPELSHIARFIRASNIAAVNVDGVLSRARRRGAAVATPGAPAECRDSKDAREAPWRAPSGAVGAAATPTRG